MTQANMLVPGLVASGTGSLLPSSPHSKPTFGQLCCRGGVFPTAAVNTGFKDFAGPLET